MVAPAVPNVLKNVLRFTGLVVGVPSVLPHLMSINSVAIAPRLVIPQNSGYIVSADATNVTVTRLPGAGGALDVYCEYWHSIESVLPLPGQLVGLTPFVLNPSGLGLTLTGEGNTVIVDAVFGNDATGQREGLWFKTIAPALAAALPGDAVLVHPGVYDLPAGITIPAGVALIGTSPNTTMLQMLNVTADTTLVTMSADSRLEAFELNLTSAEHHALVAIHYPGLTSASARIRVCRILVDNSGAGAGNSDVIGVLSDGNGSPSIDIENLDDVNTIVRSTGTGTKRGILVNGPNTLIASDMLIDVVGVGIGVETDDPGAIFTGRALLIDGVDADISQTQGELRLGGASDLANSNANGLGFMALFHPNTMQFGDPGNLPNGTRYFYPGTSQVSNSVVQIRIPSAAVMKSLSVQVQTAPGAGKTTVITIQKNGIDTALVLTLADAETTKANDTDSVGFAAGDMLSVKVVNDGATAETVVVVELF